MEIRVVLRGALAGFVAGLLAFVFSRIFAEPVIDKAIAYESGRDAAIARLDRLAGHPVTPDGPEIFSRTIQSGIGIFSGIVAFSTAMGALVAVAYLVLHGRFGVRPRTLGLLVAGFGFLGVYLVPFVKYPANPPAIGHEFTIASRGHLYLIMLACSLVLLGLAVYLGRRLQPRFGTFTATLLATGAFLVLISVVIGLLPSLGDLSANVAHQHDVGYGRSSTETPLPIRAANGDIVYPGFPADVLWKFRFYSVINQLIIWTVTGLIFSVLLQRYLDRRDQPVLINSPGSTVVGG